MGEWAGVVWVLIPVVAIVGGIASAITATIARGRVRELEIKERIALIEKGIVPPPEVDPQGFDRAMGRYDSLQRFGGRRGAPSPRRDHAAGRRSRPDGPDRLQRQPRRGRRCRRVHLHSRRRLPHQQFLRIAHPARAAESARTAGSAFSDSIVGPADAYLPPPSRQSCLIQVLAPISSVVAAALASAVKALKNKVLARS